MTAPEQAPATVEGLMAMVREWHFAVLDERDKGERVRRVDSALRQFFASRLAAPPTPPAPQGEPVELLTDEEVESIAARIGSMSLNATRLHELGGGLTRTILDPLGLQELAAEVQRAVLAKAGLRVKEGE